MAHSYLMIPVAALDPLPRVPDGAHVTLLGPFVARAQVTTALCDELRSFFAGMEPFDFELGTVRVFPGGPAYLEPSPADMFRLLTDELYARYPDFPPYVGEFAEVVPHLTIGPVASDDDLAALRAELDPRLPIACTATEAQLYWSEPGVSRTLERFPLGGEPAHLIPGI